MALDLFDRRGQRFGRGGVADPPTGHRIGFGETVDGDGQVVQVGAERGDRDMRRIAIDEFLIDLV